MASPGTPKPPSIRRHDRRRLYERHREDSSVHQNRMWSYSLCLPCRRQALRPIRGVSPGHTLARSICWMAQHYEKGPVRQMRAGYHPTRKKPEQKSSGKKEKEECRSPGGQHDGRNPTLKEQGFYHKPVWRRLRVQALQRDHYLCQLRISPKCTRIATEVHHIKSLEDFPELGLSLDNLTSCCWWCHEETKVRVVRPDLPSSVRVIRVTDGSETDGWRNVD